MDTLQFLLFLYVQQLHKLSLRRSLLGDEWPSNRSKCPGLPGKSAAGNKVLEPLGLSLALGAALRGLGKGLPCAWGGFTSGKV